MKKYLLFFSFLLATELTFAQKIVIYPAEYAKNHIGQYISVDDSVKACKIINAEVKLLELGAKYSNEQLTVVIKGSEITLDPRKLVGRRVFVSGKVTLYKNKPQIVVTEADNLKMIRDATDE